MGSCIAPLVDRSKAQVIQGGAGGQSPTEGGLEWLPLPTKLDSRGNWRTLYGFEGGSLDLPNSN